MSVFHPAKGLFTRMTDFTEQGSALYDGISSGGRSSCSGVESRPTLVKNLIQGRSWFPTGLG